MRIITKELFPIDGEAGLGYNVDMGYFAQNQEDVLDKNDTVFDTLDKIAVGDIRTKLRDILGAFLFRGEDIDKKVAVLSGGERARLAMAKLMLKPHNLLALDEPTNHMDLISKDILKQALQAYDGTLVIVSHDRDFLDGLVDKIYEFKDGKVKEHLGGVQDFLARKRLENLNELERKAPASQASAGGAGAEKVTGNETIGKQENKAQAQLTYQQMKEIEREKSRLKKKIEQCEKRIEELEGIIAGLEEELCNVTAPDKILELTAKYETAKRELDEKMDEWAKLSE